MEIAQRLKIAQERTREAYEVTYEGRDIHPGTEIAGAWPFITAAYSGIEQTFKYLIAESRGMSVRELVEKRVTKSGKTRQSPYRHHDLGKLFVELSDPVRGILSEQYRQFRTLHTYIPSATVAAFLTEVSAESGQGYVLWRYSLTSPERTIPTNSAEALLSIWDVAAQLCRISEEGGRVRGTQDRLTEGFAWGLEKVMDELNVQRIERGEPWHDFFNESTRWIREHGGPLNAYAELAHRAYRKMPLLADPIDVSPPFVECLKRWIFAGDGGGVSARSDVNVFVARAQGRRGSAQSVRWNEESMSFEEIPWCLPETTSDEEPSVAYRIHNDFRDERWHIERCRILARGFDVRERHLLRCAMPESKWLCTLSGEKVVQEDKVTIRFWEHRDIEDALCVEVSGDENTQEVRLLRDVMRQGDGRSEKDGGAIVE